MRRTLMHGSRCAAASSRAVGRQPHGASRWGRGRTCMRAECSVQPIAFRVQRQPQLIGDRANRPATERYEPVEARSRQASAQRGQDGALASRVCVCVCWGGAEAEGGTHAWLTAQQRRSSRNARWRSIRCNRRGCGTARQGTAWPGGLAAFQDRRRQRHASECVGGRRTQAIRSIRTGITWKVESATTAQGRSSSSARR